MLVEEWLVNNKNNKIYNSFIDRISKKYRSKFINKYKSKLSEEEYILLKFKDKKLTYQEHNKLLNKCKRRYASYSSHLEKFIFNKIQKKVNKIINRFVAIILTKIPDRYKEEAFILNINTFTLCYQFFMEAFRINQHKELPFFLFSHLRILDKYSNEFKIENYEKLHDKYIDYINKYFTSIDDYIIDISAEEISFMHKGNDKSRLWSNAYSILFYLLNYYPKNIEAIQATLEGIYRNRELELENIKYLSKYQQRIIIEKIKLNKIRFDYNTPTGIKLIFKYFPSLTYEDKKEIIYSRCNDCCGIIFGDRKLSSYNLPFENILTKEDYQYMIDNLIFIGNNSIKIKTGE